MEKIKMPVALVEMDGDEMTRVIWAMLKEKLIAPYIELNTEYYDLSLPNRDATDDAVTAEAAAANRRLGVAVKCATITPNLQRQEEYHLKRLYPSPNATIRAALDGTVFRTPILLERIKPAVRSWTAPITIARHAYGDVYKAAELRVEGGSAALCLTAPDGSETRKPIFDFGAQGGVLQGQFNRVESIDSFARACFAYALAQGQDLWFSTKDTISKLYDGLFKERFQTIFDAEYRAQFEQRGITYFYTLIDDAVARVIRSSGGFIWALKNYDGDVMSDMVSTAFGSLAMMTSVLVSPDGKFEYEAAHGTVTQHYYRYRRGEATSTNPVATLFAWTGALRKRGELDGVPALGRWADCMERAALLTIERGTMTKDLAALTEGEVTVVNTAEYLDAVHENFKTLWEVK